MNQNTHRPFLFIVFAYMFGILLFQWTRLSYALIFALTFLTLFLVWRSKRRVVLSSIFLLVAFAGLGLLHIKTVSLSKKDHVIKVARFYRKKAVEIKGYVVSDIQKREQWNSIKTTFTIEVDQIKSPWGWKKKSGKLLVNVFRDLDIFYGDYVLIEGKMHTPYNFSKEGNFSYKNYLGLRQIYLILSVKKQGRVDVLENKHGHYFKKHSLKVRQHLKIILNKYLTANEAGLMQAMLLGDRSHIPKNIRELFVRTGTVHVLAISGLHVGVVAGLFFIFFKLFRLPRYAQYCLTILLLIGYIFLTGGRASVLRATIMICIFLGSFILERSTNSLNTLSVAAFLILLMNPFNLFDIGFQLSFTCVVSIILFSSQVKWLITKFFGYTETAWIKYLYDSLTVSISVWIGIVGLIAYYFNIITPVTIVANLVIVPLMAAVVALGFGLLLMWHIFAPLAVPIAFCIKLVLNMMAGAIFIFDQIPYAYLFVKSVTLWKVMTYYTIIAILYCFLRHYIMKNKQKKFIADIKYYS